MTALMWSAFSGKVEAMELLLKHEASTLIQNKDGKHYHSIHTS